MFSNSPFSIIVKKSKVYADNISLYVLIKKEIEQYGSDCSLNHIDVSGVTNMNYLFHIVDFKEIVQT